MKTTKQIARECNVSRGSISSLVHRYGIKGSILEGNKKEVAFSKSQENEIHKILHQTKKAEFLTLESSMNPEKQMIVFANEDVKAGHPNHRRKILAQKYLRTDNFEKMEIILNQIEKL